jgi:hypothetical protein
VVETITEKSGGFTIYLLFSRRGTSRYEISLAELALGL